MCLPQSISLLLWLGVNIKLCSISIHNRDSNWAHFTNTEMSEMTCFLYLSTWLWSTVSFCDINNVASWCGEKCSLISCIFDCFSGRGNMLSTLIGPTRHWDTGVSSAEDADNSSKSFSSFHFKTVVFDANKTEVFHVLWTDYHDHVPQTSSNQQTLCIMLKLFWCFTFTTFHLFNITLGNPLQVGNWFIWLLYKTPI